MLHATEMLAPGSSPSGLFHVVRLCFEQFAVRKVLRLAQVVRYERALYHMARRR